jgi:hypothetical protein
MGETEQNVTQVCNTSGLKGGARAGKVGRPAIVWDVERARFERARGKTFSQIAKLFGVSRATVFNALKKEGEC